MTTPAGRNSYPRQVERVLGDTGEDVNLEENARQRLSLLGDDPDLDTALMDNGADDYMRKPIEPASLVACVKVTLCRAA